MPSISRHARSRSLLAVLALVLAGLAFSLATSSAGADQNGAAQHRVNERLVVRGNATIVDGPCNAGVCPLEIVDGSFRGTTGTGDYSGSIELNIAEAFPNGEGGVCAPIDTTMVLGTGSPNRLVLSVSGDSCQDGAGPVTAASFTGLARFTVKYGTGTFAGARGSGLATFLEDAADQDRMTLIGQISR
jgi:hypothetical protein